MSRPVLAVTWSPMLRYRRRGSSTQGVPWPLPPAHRLSGHTRQKVPGQELNFSPFFFMQAVENKSVIITGTTLNLS